MSGIVPRRPTAGARSTAASYAQRVRSFVLSVTGRDRPGIVAAVTRVLLDHRLNLEDAEMAILRGHFAVMLVLAAPADVDEEALRADLERVRAAVPLETVSLTEVPALDAPPAAASHSISVYGADHPGIVHGVAEALAGGERQRRRPEHPRARRGRRRAALRDAARGRAAGRRSTRPASSGCSPTSPSEQGVDVSVRPVDGDVL